MILGISIIRWVLIVLSLFVITDRLLKFARREAGQSLFKFISSLTIWSVILLISIYPDFAYFIAGKLGMGKNLNTLIFFGFVVVFMLIFKMLSIIEHLESQITEIVRATAIKKDLKDKKINVRKK